MLNESVDYSNQWLDLQSSGTGTLPGVVQTPLPKPFLPPSSVTKALSEPQFTYLLKKRTKHSGGNDEGQMHPVLVNGNVMKE
jgi:hypothetical protein